MKGDDPKNESEGEEDAEGAQDEAGGSEEAVACGGFGLEGSEPDIGFFLGDFGQSVEFEIKITVNATDLLVDFK